LSINRRRGITPFPKYRFSCVHAAKCITKCVRLSICGYDRETLENRSAIFTTSPLIGKFDRKRVRTFSIKKTTETSVSKSGTIFHASARTIGVSAVPNRICGLALSVTARVRLSTEIKTEPEARAGKNYGKRRSNNPEKSTDSFRTTTGHAFRPLDGLDRPVSV